ncbi:branched-chain amino acid transporter II carrier protein [Bhargavaea cecembensis]|uniref:Branched-chain amino acid transport system carrier protein n=1 Tax=Bhargavaea cecembensis TaxID=394098 RepID=A0A163EP06_9BACL|nr:branched-chain amino acid transport system II carrier protein [Bhargavaea cecembensis]KZE36841.1 branched-chain amino acid transporter II carrier protein [Bhargavaea cecembensis]
MQEKMSLSNYIAVGSMLFALFFGAGNLIFPAQLGQQAGENLWPAILGFLVTGVGLPFLGVIAIGYSGSNHLQELASRVHPLYGVLFTSILYLTIGPFFAAPRTGTVAYEIGITPYVGTDAGGMPLFLFTLAFFAVTLWLSLNPAKIVDRVGKILAPGIVILLAILIAMAVFRPMGDIQPATEPYAEGAFTKGFTEGYNTMDAIAALVFAIIVVNAVKAMGMKSKKAITSATFRAGLIAILLLAVLYIGIAFIGATSVQLFGMFETGGPVLSSAATHFFGSFGTLLMSVVIILACLTTAIGLISANGEYFHSLFPKISYKAFVWIFTVFTFTIANFGLSNIITFSVPMLMLLYPLAISLLLLTFTSKLFHHSRIVYVAATTMALIIGIIDGLKALAGSLDTEFGWLVPVDEFLTANLPLYSEGLGWVLPVIAALVITGTIARLAGPDTEERPN